MSQSSEQNSGNTAPKTNEPAKTAAPVTNEPAPGAPKVTPPGAPHQAAPKLDSAAKPAVSTPANK